MGRPISKKYFGNLNTPGGFNGVGGEGVALVTIGTNPVSTLSVTVSFSAPDIPGGTTATGVVVKPANTVTAVTVTNSGTGYTSAPTVTFTGTNMTTVGDATATLMTSFLQNAIQITAYVTGGSSAVAGDILKQESSRKYLVRTAQGTSQVKLVTTSTLIAGEGYITALDVLGNSYFVDKLTSRKARLYQYTLTTGTFEYSTATLARWSFDAATTGTVQVSNH